MTQDSGDLVRLREEFPGWRFGTTWATVNTGPDVKRLTAVRGSVLLTAWTAAEMALKIRHEDAS